MEILKKKGIILLMALVVSQFFGAEKNNGDLTFLTAFFLEIKPQEEALKNLGYTCFDFYLLNINYPFYKTINPINYCLDSDLKDDEKRLIFFKCDVCSLKNKERKIVELYEEVDENEMPLKSYTWSHGDANLIKEQIVPIVCCIKKVQIDYKKLITLR